MATADVLKNPFEFESRAKATEGKAGMAGERDVHVRRSTAGTGLRVGAADAVLPATDEVMAVTARRDEQPFFAYAPPPRVRAFDEFAFMAEITEPPPTFLALPPLHLDRELGRSIPPGSLPSLSPVLRELSELVHPLAVGARRS